MMDRIKENLFNLLGPHFVPGTIWLDAFAGTGQVGIEALSRGAAIVIFLDTERAAIRTIHQNLERTKLGEGATVLRADAFAYLHRRSFEPFDVIFVAPPQYKKIWSRVLFLLDNQPSRYLKSDGIVVVQIDPTEFEELELTRLRLYDRRDYGNTALCFYEQGVDE
jgi:16S rRNA (guanine(966)-N(2))-methyltransferase RsmD